MASAKKCVWCHGGADPPSLHKVRRPSGTDPQRAHGSLLTRSLQGSVVPLSEASIFLLAVFL